MYDFLREKSISEAKQEFPSVFREAIKGYEVIAANHKSTKVEDTVSIISTEMYEEILNQAFPFKPIIEKDEKGKGYTIALDEIMVFGDGDTIKDAFEDLIDNVIEYIKLYFEKIDFYRQIPNRKGHYPFLRRLAKHASDRTKMMEVIAEWDTRLQQETLKKLRND